MRIRPARPDHAETLFAIQRTTSLGAFAHIFPPDAHPFPDAEIRAVWVARLADPEVTTLVAEEEGHAVGYVAFRRESLDSLFVLPEAQGAGVGAALHDEVLERERQSGRGVCRLWVLEQNEQARRFYERRGWRPDGRTRIVPFPPQPTALGYSVELG
ncbi:MAG: N-acetyltransferase family protein [Gaiellaceae bacterium]